MHRHTALTVVVSILMFGFGYSVAEVGEPLTAYLGGGPVRAAESVSTAPPSTPLIVLRTTDLSEDKRKLVAALGIADEEISITPEMLSCAEAKVSVPRLADIARGAAPSASEATSLAACYRENR